MPYVSGRTFVAAPSARTPARAVERRRVTRRVVVGGLGDHDELAGIKIRKPSFKKLSRAVKKVARPVQRAARKAGHAIGKAATSKVSQAIIGTALAATGVGLVPAALIGAGVKGGGALLRPGGTLRKAGRAAGQGAIVGAGASVVGKGARKGLSVLKREKIVRTAPPPPAKPDVLDQLTAKSKLPKVKLTGTTGTTLSVVKQKAPAPADLIRDRIRGARERTRKARREKVPEKPATSTIEPVTAAPELVQTTTAAPAPAAAPAGGGGSSATESSSSSTDLAAIAQQQAQQAAGGGGIFEFVKQNPVAVAGAAIAVAGTIAYAMSRGGRGGRGGRRRSA